MQQEEKAYIIKARNELAKELELVGNKIQYDVACKRVLSQKEFLARILQKVVKEFEGYSLDVIKSCIEGEPEISTDTISFDVNGKIIGLSNESKDINGGEIYYDIRFSVCLPGSNSRIGMIINLEAQKSFYAGYHMETRGITYACRQISDQIGNIVTKSNYDDLKKVYTIFLCMNAPQKAGNCIARYRVEKDDIVVGYPDDPDAYDKLVVVLICLNEKKKTDDEFLSMMNTLFSLTISTKEKEATLEKKYGIPMTTIKEVNQMCNISQYVFEKGEEKGKVSLIKEMILQGAEDNFILSVSGFTKEKLEELKNELLQEA